MSRPKRSILKNCCCHITHRCHNRNFLFRFSHERNMYRKLLMEMSKNYRVSIMDYTITSNHIHLLLHSDDISSISNGMRFIQGTIAQRYNRKKQREGAFWRDRYHITLVENGYHLSRCLFYIGFNMIRAGVISHPEKWRWSGYDELSGQRQRYRVIDMNCLLASLGIPKYSEFRDWYNRSIENEIGKYHVRQEFWSQSLAVGSEEWINDLSENFPRGKRSILQQIYDRDIDFKIGEEQATYTLQASKKDASNFTRKLKG